MSWRRIRTSLGAGAGLAAFVATAILALTRGGGGGATVVPVNVRSPVGELRAPAAAGPFGPEQVPIPAAAPLGRVRLVATDRKIDGISCQAREQVLFHIHAHLTIFVNGVPRRVPAAIGVAPPYDVEQTPVGAFIAGGSCFMWLHTHAADGIIHIESPVDRPYTLGDFFDIWGQRLDREHAGSAHGPVTAVVDGRVFSGDPRRIPLLAHAQIQLDVGQPRLVAEQIAFPEGL